MRKYGCVGAQDVSHLWTITVRQHASTIGRFAYLVKNVSSLREWTADLIEVLVDTIVSTNVFPIEVLDFLAEMTVQKP
jgi:hypothetical protein